MGCDSALCYDGNMYRVLLKMIAGCVSGQPVTVVGQLLNVHVIPLILKAVFPHSGKYFRMWWLNCNN